MVMNKYNPSPLQMIYKAKKKSISLEKTKIPDYTTMKQSRTNQLVLLFLATTADITKPKITLQDFCKKHEIGENTVRNALKKITNSSIRKPNPNSNNIGKRHENIKEINKKIAKGEQINENEEELLESYKNQKRNSKEALHNKKVKNLERGGCYNLINETLEISS